MRFDSPVYDFCEWVADYVFMKCMGTRVGLGKQGREGVKRSLPCLFVGLLIAVRTLQYRSTGRRRCACEMLQAGVRTTDIDAWESFLLLREGLESGKSTG